MRFRKRKKILSLDPAGLLWGSERALLDFIGDISDFETACCCPPNSPLVSKLKCRNIKCFPFFRGELHLKGKGSRFLALIGLVIAIWKFKPNVLHVNQAGSTRIALLACRFFRIPCVVHVRLLEDVEYLDKLKPLPKYLKRLIAISEPIAAQIETKPNLHGIPCNMMLDAYCTQRGYLQLERLVTQKPKHWDFICIGRFSASKGQGILIRAIGELKKVGVNATLVFVGEINDYAREIQHEAVSLGLESFVTFLGHLDNVYDALAQARWLVCPSNYEPLGRVLFEAWDVGTPVIAGQFSGGAASSIISSGGGLLYREWSPSSLAETLSTALKMESSLIDLHAKCGWDWLVPNTDPKRYSDWMSRTFQNVLTS
jgi:glycosyltransferase involved in cell wall biosynthesis